jgi:hypothetical protein
MAHGSNPTVSFFFFSYGCTHIATDISGSNIAFTCGKLSSATEKNLFKILGTPQIENLVRLDGKPLDKALPKYLVEAAEWSHWVDEIFGLLTLERVFSKEQNLQGWDNFRRIL